MTVLSLEERAERSKCLRFLLQIAPTTSDECISWPHFREHSGYGKICVNRKSMYAHTYMCELVHGPAPFFRAQAAHNCHNGYLGCVNPNHLRWATPKENTHDMWVHAEDTGESDLIRRRMRKDAIAFARSRDKRIPKVPETWDPMTHVVDPSISRPAVKIYAAIREMWLEHGHSPSQMELRDATLYSITTVVKTLNELRAKKYISFQKFSTRSIVLTDWDRTLGREPQDPWDSLKQVRFFKPAEWNK